MRHRARQFDRTRLRSAIQQTSRRAAEPPQGFDHLSGPLVAERLGYSDEMLQGIPDATLGCFSGVGNPFASGPIRPGERVLDVGCGCGLDSLIAARLVGPDGAVVAVDMTAEMILTAWRSARSLGLANTRFYFGFAERLPVASESVDVVISNGAINLCPDKDEVFGELFRVLRPGGRLQIADVLVAAPVPAYLPDLVELWTDRVAGGLTKYDYLESLAASGFIDLEVSAAYDVFRDGPVEASAARFGARGFNICGRK